MSSVADLKVKLIQSVKYRLSPFIHLSFQVELEDEVQSI